MIEIDKLKLLKEYLKNLNSVVIAFSAGVDSTFLLKAAHDVLGSNAVAVTLQSSFVPQAEIQEAKNFASENNIEQKIISINYKQIPNIENNPADRCYHCKKYLFTKIIEEADKLGIKNVLDGSNIDDDTDYRPGMRAVKELGIISPLKELGFTKEEIRKYSKELGLKTWDKPSYACLASRFPYGNAIEEQALHMVENAEAYLISLGFKQVRVRIHNDLARIEVEKDTMIKLLDTNIMAQVYDKLKKIGFSYVCLDLSGYRVGSMNEVINTLPEGEH